MAGVVNYHGLEHNPVGLWQLNGSLADTSGNGFTLTVESGTVFYGYVQPGLRGALLNSTVLIYNTFTSTLAITGDLTIEALVYLPAYTVSQRYLVSHANAGETAVDNYLYGISLLNGSGKVDYFAESGVGVDIVYNPVIADTNRPPLSPCHFAMTRSSQVVQFYLNGRTWGAASGTLGTPTGGGSGRFRIGGTGSIGGPEGITASVKVIASALTAAQVAVEYNRTLGGFYGFYAP